jgi:hypothetical protein
MKAGAIMVFLLATLASWSASGQTSDKKDTKDTGQVSDNKDVNDKDAKRKLKGGFRGHSVDPAGPAGSREVHPVNPPAPPQEQQASEKQKPLVINNAMVKSKEPAPAPAGKKAAAPTPAPTVTTSLPSASYSELSEATTGPTDLDGHNEAYWREKARTTRERVAKSKENLQQIEAEEKKLENDFYAWDDGQYRDDVIKPAWDRAKDALASASAEAAEAEQAEKDLSEEARKAGALPGWIRE